LDNAKVWSDTVEKPSIVVMSLQISHGKYILFSANIFDGFRDNHLKGTSHRNRDNHLKGTSHRKE
jgi:hypothetical protein